MNKGSGHLMRGYPWRQTGSILIYGLILLLVMTVVVTAAIHSAGFEERMSGNVMDNNIAFQAAEAALRDSETQLSLPTVPDCSSPPTSGNVGFWCGQASSLRWSAMDWTSPTSIRSYTGFSGSTGAFSRVTAASYIEQLTVKQQRSFGDSIVRGRPTNDDDTYFRVTARGVGMTGNDTVILESIYKR